MDTEVREQLVQLINKVDSKEDLEHINALVKVRWNSLRAVATATALAKGILPGAKVTFVARGQQFAGTVVKVNSKTVAVRTDTGTWRVTPTMLNLVP